MKTFTFQDCPPGEDTTLTVFGLREILSEYPDDMPVLATWEGIFTLFRGKNHYNPRNKETSDYVEVKIASPWSDDGEVPCLIFSVDKY